MINYIISFISVIITSVVGSLYTSKTTKSDWFKCIKPSITPPNYVFPIVWTTLYILIGFAFGLSIKYRIHIINILFVFTLILNILWSYFYFGRKQVKTALYIIFVLIILGLLIIVIAINTKQYRIAGLIFPYVMWISFASVLNYMSIEKAKNCN